MVEVPASRSADIIGFHPDGRRLFVHVVHGAPASAEAETRLVIVDVVTRTVIRNRPFEEIGFASDFVDE